MAQQPELAEQQPQTYGTAKLVAKVEAAAQGDAEQLQRMEKNDLPDRPLRLLQTKRCLLAIDNLESVLTSEGEWQSGYREIRENG